MGSTRNASEHGRRGSRTRVRATLAHQLMEEHGREAVVESEHLHVRRIPPHQRAGRKGACERRGKQPGCRTTRKLRLRASLSTVTLPARKSPEQLWDYVGCVEPPPPPQPRSTCNGVIRVTYPR